MQTRYRIYELSARAVMSCAAEENGIYTFRLGRSATERCRVYGALHEQDSSALFFQIMSVLRGDAWEEPDGALVPDLADAIFYMDFSGIFDRNSTKRHRERQRKAEDMFRPEGVCLDFGSNATWPLSGPAV